MKATNMKYINFWICVLILFTVRISIAQTREEVRAREHQAVKQLISTNSQKYQKAIDVSQPPQMKPNRVDRTAKATGHGDRKYYFMNGNKIGSDIYNYGGIGPGYGLLRGVNNFVWHNLDYVFQFCPIFGAAVPEPFFIHTFALSGSTIFAGANTGFFISTDNGVTWSASNAGLTNLNIASLAVTGTKIYAGTSGGVFVSTNNGGSWKGLNTGITDTYIGALVVSGSNVFAGTRKGVFLTTVNDSVWNAAGLTNKVINALAVNGSQMMAGTNDGIFISTDNGTNWTEASSGLSNKKVNAFLISGSNIFSATNNGVYLSTNSGITWTSVSTGLGDTIVYALKFSGSTLFAGTGKGIYSSINNGSNWVVSNTGFDLIGIESFGVIGTTVIAGTRGEGMYSSTNNGASWSYINSGIQKRMHIISDALWDYPGRYRETSPMGDTLWQFQPLPEYADPNQPHMASNPAPDKDKDGKPDSWPRHWYNPDLGKYVWPGYLSQDVGNADLEVFWGMDDRDNREFPYFPFRSDSTRKGLGLKVEGRAFQWSNSLAENCIFLVYSITNVSEKDLDTVVFGIYGDPDLGGGSPENTDDNGFFVPPYSTPTVDVTNIPVYARSMAYYWDPDMKGALGLPLGYLGCKFLESPGNPNDGIDNDGDGMIDERQDDGIDNDKDWTIANDDIGVDGIPNTNDEGEGNGVPDAGKKLADGSPDPLYPGEPNFEYTDLDESDQNGLTSFNSWTWATDYVSVDESMWNRTIPRNFGDIQQSADIVFIFGSGYINLKKGETKRISMALLCGWTLDDLLTTAETVQRIYNQNYRFFKPPITPTVTAVPGDRKVTLFWDTKAEESIDPLTAKDFEGYVIYRSTDPSFNDIQTISDGKGAPFLSTPLKDYKGFECKWDIDSLPEPYNDANNNGRYDQGETFTDLNRDGKWQAKVEDFWKGYHPVPYRGRGIQYYLGSNRGLVHTFVDSNNVINGQTYYYAVVAYDHGDSTDIPPTETTKKISVDPITSKLEFDVNTVQVIPGPRAGGYVSPVITSQNVTHDLGRGTGQIKFEILNDIAVREQGDYQLVFKDSASYRGTKIRAKNYSVLDKLPITESFVTYDTNFANLRHSHLSDDSYLKVTDETGKIYTSGIDYILSLERGAIRRTGTSTMANQAKFFITYRYYPLYESQALKGEDVNAVVEGVKIKVFDEPGLAVNSAKTGWTQGNCKATYTIALSTVGSRKSLYPADYEITFSDVNIDTALFLTYGKKPVPFTVKVSIEGVLQRVFTFVKEPVMATKNGKWEWNEEICIFVPGATGLSTDTLTWGVIISPTPDSVMPTKGDVFTIVTKRPFNGGVGAKWQDVYTLKTTSGKEDKKLAASRLDKIYVVPNPYVGFSEIEPTNKLPGQTRGEKRVYFENLPRECTIRIYTLAGTPVQTLHHSSSLENGREYWNLLNRDGFTVSYGVYVAHIDAPGIGEKIVKFALIK